MKKTLGILLVLSVLIVPIAVSAALIKTSNDLSLRRNEIIGDDIYAAAGNISSQAIINGDFVGAGGNIFLSGSTTQDVMVAGGTINLAGVIGDDVRAAGGNIAITGSIKDDAIIMGGQISIVSGSVIGGDAILTGGNIVVDGDILGRLEARGGRVVINGPVRGTVEITADDVVIGSRAIILGKVTYSSPKQAEIQKGSEIRGDIVYKKVQASRNYTTVGGDVLVKLLVLAVSALVIQWLLGKIADQLAFESSQNALRNLGIGFLFIIAVPVAAIIIMITVVGIPIAIMIVLGYIITLIFTMLFLPIVVGAVAWKYFTKSETLVLNWKTALIGVLITMIISLVPFVGSFILFIAGLVVLGALAKFKWQYVKQMRG